MRRIAQAHADRLGESVYLYEAGTGDDDSGAKTEEIKPSKEK